MISSDYQIAGEISAAFRAESLPGSRRGLSAPDSASQDEKRPAMDRYIPHSDVGDSGIYTRDSLVAAMSESETDGDAVSEERQQAAMGSNELDEADKDLIDRLQARDREVRAHEQSHVAAAGEYVRGAPTYTYQMGPDGKMYAIGGQVAVDVGKEADSSENLRKAHMISGAALGVDDPSAADASVAAMAGDLMRDAFTAVA